MRGSGESCLELSEKQVFSLKAEIVKLVIVCKNFRSHRVLWFCVLGLKVHWKGSTPTDGFDFVDVIEVDSRVKLRVQSIQEGYNLKPDKGSEIYAPLAWQQEQ